METPVPWDDKTNKLIITARLKASPPEVVYAELREYSAFLQEVYLLAYNEDMEKTLLGRNDPLINLGLAQFAASDAVIALLYKRGFVESSDAAYGKALRLACLSNRSRSGFLPSLKRGIDEDEVRRLAHEGDRDEIWAMLQNPANEGIVRALLCRREPFDSLPTDRLCWLVYAATGNPRINIDKSNGSDPDLLGWDIQRGIYQLVSTAPLEDEWAKALYFLLADLSPAAAMTPETDPRPVIARWADLRMKKSYGNKDQDEEGLRTELPFVEEFRCLIGALYGRQWVDKKFAQIGGPDDADVALRCAFYGKSTLTVSQMKAARERDGATFVMAALRNMHIYWSRECRAALEDMLSADLFADYKRRLEQLRHANPRLDLRPLTESASELGGTQQPPSEEREAIARLETSVGKIEKRLQEFGRNAYWAVIIILVALWWWKR